MQISETFRAPDRPQKTSPADIRQEAQRMIERHERQLKDLRDREPSGDSFRESALQATEAFKVQLRNFLKAHGAEDLYEELVGFVSGKVAEIVSGSSERSSLS